MGLSSVVEWWQEWQLRILVLSSTAIQVFLNIFANRRKHITSSRFRSVIWLAFLGSDAVAIYALATLFNRHKNQDSCSSTLGSTSILEVVWAPALLIHLGGQDAITAYNIEDNELWKRKVVTMVSQVTVSIYVFCNSLFLFYCCRQLLCCLFLEFSNASRSHALRSASINSLVSSDSIVPMTGKGNEEGDAISLETYVKRARKIVMENGDPLDDSKNTSSNVDDNEEPYKLCVDLSLPYYTRLVALNSWWNITGTDAHHRLAKNLADIFYRLYTKSKVIEKRESILFFFANLLRIGSVYLPFAAIGLFHNSHREAYNNYDTKVTYTLLCCTAVVEAFNAYGFNTPVVDKYLAWLYKVSQCNIISSYASITIKRCNCIYIIESVLQHIKSGWKDYITDATSYRAFNDHRGQWVLRRHNCDREDLAWSLRVPFDESVLLWHLATDFCFVSRRYDDEGATRSIEISNYMMYLLLNNPEMLMAGTRRNLFTTATAELKDILGKGPLEEEKDLANKIKIKVESITKGRCSFTRDDCALSEKLLSLGEDKMWKVIKGVWLEMLCFSASRCRGYLHAKGLGTGGELLTFVWLLLLHMGMEPLAERLQRVEFPSGAGNRVTDASPLPSDETTLADRQHKTEISSREGNIGDVPSTSKDSIAIDIEEDLESTMLIDIISSVFLNLCFLFT